MIELTRAQRRVIRRMHGYQAVAQLTQGAVLVARTGKEPKPMMIGADGREFSFRRLLLGLDEHS